jgi:hypothetical protein
MNYEQRGKYITLLCLQHQQGFLTDEDLKNVLDDTDLKIKSLSEEMNSLKEPLENKRMLWLFGALAVVIGGLLFSYSSAKKKSEVNASGNGRMNRRRALISL